MYFCTPWLVTCWKHKGLQESWFYKRLCWYLTKAFLQFCVLGGHKTGRINLRPSSLNTKIRCATDPYNYWRFSTSWFKSIYLSLFQRFCKLQCCFNNGCQVNKIKLVKIITNCHYVKLTNWAICPICFFLISCIMQ